ncbi:unnamed protein product [Toxocara canis]|uniref:Uncharacterized protein n=1 Tax=Toxocara canis TaxID=6265 RepID=A0A183UEE0_TOXCA|nr:unnamed protein product [Toxocara canis]
MRHLEPKQRMIPVDGQALNAFAEQLQIAELFHLQTFDEFQDRALHADSFLPGSAGERERRIPNFVEPLDYFVQIQPYFPNDFAPIPTGMIAAHSSTTGVLVSFGVPTFYVKCGLLATPPPTTINVISLLGSFDYRHLHCYLRRRQIG